MVSIIQKCNLVRQVHTKLFIEKVKPSDRKEVLRLMTNVFYKTDPSSRYTQVAENPSVSQTIQEMTIEPLEEDLSFTVRVDKNDEQIVGAIINGVRPIVLDPDYMDDLIKGIRCERERTLLELWRFVGMKPDNPEKYFGKEKDILEFRYMAVDPNYLNRGIARSLVMSSRDEACAKGFRFIRMDCTSNFTARIASKLGLKCIFALNYVDYRTPRGEKLIKEVVPPHTSIRVFIGELVS